MPGGVLLLCLVGALAGHVVLLVLGAEEARRWQQAQLQVPPATAPQPVTVRHLGPGPAETAAARQAVDTPRIVHPARPASASAAAPVPADVPDVVAPVAAPVVYVPRALLTVPPVARKSVPLVWPDNWPAQASYTAVLKLFLDEQGQVKRVEPDGDPVLPEPLFEQARQAFMAAGFTPGELNGQAVKSWVRVEVTFDSGSRPPGH